MEVTAVALWMFRRALGRPGSWLWLAGVAALWPASVAFAPLSLSAAPDQALELAYEVAFVSLVLGHAVGRATLDRVEGFLERAAPLRRLILEGIALTAAALPFLAFGLAPPLLVGGLAGQEVLGLLGRATAAHVQLGAISALLARSPVGAPARPALLAGLVWVLPAVCGPAGAAGAFVGRSLGVAARLRAESVSDAWKAACGPIIGWLAAALLLHARSDADPRSARS